MKIESKAIRDVLELSEPGIFLWGRKERCLNDAHTFGRSNIIDLHVNSRERRAAER